LADIPPIPESEVDLAIDIIELCFQNDAMIRFYFKENPDNLDDYEYARRIKELKFLAKGGMLKSM
jgi:hypothetical protein